MTLMETLHFIISGNVKSQVWSDSCVRQNCVLVGVQKMRSHAMPRRLCIDADGSRTTLEAGDSLVNVFISPLQVRMKLLQFPWEAMEVVLSTWALRSI